MKLKKWLIEFMTKLPKIRINYIENRCRVTRQTAATYLNSLVDIGLLEFEKVGRESIYKNTRLIYLLSNF